MAATNEPVPTELPPLPTFPVATAITTLCVLLFFAGLIYFAYSQAAKPAAAQNEERKLQDLKADQRRILENYGVNSGGPTESYRVPVNKAMESLANSKGAAEFAGVAPPPKVEPKPADPMKK